MASAPCRSPHRGQGPALRTGVSGRGILPRPLWAVRGREPLPAPQSGANRTPLPSVKEPGRASSVKPKVAATTPRSRRPSPPSSQVQLLSVVDPAQPSGSRPGTPTLRKCCPTAGPRERAHTPRRALRGRRLRGRGRAGALSGPPRAVCVARAPSRGWHRAGTRRNDGAALGRTPTRGRAHEGTLVSQARPRGTYLGGRVLSFCHAGERGHRTCKCRRSVYSQRHRRVPVRVHECAPHGVSVSSEHVRIPGAVSRVQVPDSSTFAS